MIIKISQTAILISCLLLGTTSTSYAQQNIKFYLEPSGDFLLGGEKTYSEIRESTFTQLSPFSADSAYQIRSSTTSETLTTTKIEQSFGGGLRGMMEFPIADRLSVRTGLGLRFESYTLDENLNFNFSTLSSSSDTLGKVAIPISNGGVNSLNCITVYDGFNDFEELRNFVPTYTNILLEIPLALRYEVLPNKVGVSVGATVITPLRSTYEFTFYNFNVQNHPEAPAGVCANIISLATNTTGERIADFQLAGEVSADYVLTERLRVVASASQMITDRFIQEEQTLFLNSGFTGSYRPLRLSLGIRWQLGGKE